MTFEYNNKKKNDIETKLNNNNNNIEVDTQDNNNNNSNSNIKINKSNKNKNKTLTYKLLLQHIELNKHDIEELLYQDENDTLPSVLLFLFGFISIVPWIVCVMYLNSRNQVAKGLAIASLVLFTISLLILVVLSCIYLSFFILYDDNNSEG